MMFLVSAAVFVATAFAQNPFELLPLECAIAYPQCVAKAGYSSVDDLNAALTDEAAFYAIYPGILKCLRKEKFGSVADEVDMNTGYPCGPLVVMLIELINDKTPENNDPSCRKSCAGTFASCSEGLNLLSLSLAENEQYEQCQESEAMNEEGCCECMGNCPDLPEDECMDICNDASVSEDACSKALPPYYGLCSYHKNNKMKNESRKCKLHTYWKGNCASLNRRLCKIAVEARACTPVQKAGKAKYKKCVEN